MGAAKTKKKQNRKPSIKQKRAVENLVENGGNVSKAMRDAGYSEATAKTPQKLTESVGYQELVEQHLPDSNLLEKHSKLLDTKNIGHMVFPLAMTDDEITELLETVGCTPKKFKHGDTANHVWYWQPDSTSQLKALDLAYKLKGKAQGNGNGSGGTVNVGVVFGGEELGKEFIKEVESEVK